MSEGYGFILSLQFTLNPKIDAPYFTNQEVNNMLSTFDGGNGFWDSKPDDLILMAGDIETRFGF